MWESRRLTALWASTACYRDNFTFNNNYPKWENLIFQDFRSIFYKRNQYACNCDCGAVMCLGVRNISVLKLKFYYKSFCNKYCYISAIILIMTSGSFHMTTGWKTGVLFPKRVRMERQYTPTDSGTHPGSCLINGGKYSFGYNGPGR
jgi:hypothetical protein